MSLDNPGMENLDIIPGVVARQFAVLKKHLPFLRIGIRLAPKTTYLVSLMGQIHADQKGSKSCGCSRGGKAFIADAEVCLTLTLQLSLHNRSFSA